MFRDVDLCTLVPDTLAWFQKNKRDLPWRNTTDPYAIWLSEIMLQQTRVEAVIPYYQRFLQKLPTIRDLAECPEDQLLKLWEGLGYYSRVRNMQKAARVMVESNHGQMPGRYDEIVRLPGIGAYTAGAIASRVFDEVVPAVDGNVLRILTRLTEDDSDITKDKTKKAASAWVGEVMQRSVLPQDSGAFNQALMEIGATVCVPNGAPHCGECPWQAVCMARRNETIDVYPCKSKSKPRRIENKTVLLIMDDQRIFIRKRPNRGLLAGLYEFPSFEGKLDRSDCIDMVRSMGFEPLYVEELPEAKHIFSHIEWHMIGYRIKLDSTLDKELPHGILIDIEQVQRDYPIPSALEKYAACVQLGIGASEVRKQMNI